MKKLKGLLRIVFGRTAFVVVFMLIQILILFGTFTWLADRYLVYAYWSFTLLGALVVLYIINKRENSSFKLAWIVPVLVIPVFGALFYLYVELEIGGMGLVNTYARLYLLYTDKLIFRIESNEAGGTDVIIGVEEEEESV